MTAALARSALSFVLGLVPSCVLAATLSVHVADQAAKDVGDAVVYAMPVNGRIPVRAPGAAIIDQVNKQFAPLVSVMQTGTSVSFPNKDNIRHQVYSFSPAKSFDLKLYSGVPSQPVVFDKPGLVVMGCNIHDQMVAYVQVVDTPWSAKSGSDGMARIDALPPGDYLLYAWHYRQVDPAPMVQPLHIAVDTVSRVSLPLKPRP